MFSKVEEEAETEEETEEEEEGVYSLFWVTDVSSQEEEELPPWRPPRLDHVPLPDYPADLLMKWDLWILSRTPCWLPISFGALTRTKTTTWSDFHWGRDGESNRSPHPHPWKLPPSWFERPSQTLIFGPPLLLKSVSRKSLFDFLKAPPLTPDAPLHTHPSLTTGTSVVAGKNLIVLGKNISSNNWSLRTRVCQHTMDAQHRKCNREHQDIPEAPQARCSATGPLPAQPGGKLPT